jgi:hypothetical protein
VGRLAVKVNTGGAWKNTSQTPVPAPFVNFVSTFGAAGMPLTSDGVLKADFQSAFLRVESDTALLNLFGFFYLKFDKFAIEKGSGLLVNGSTGIDLLWATANGLLPKLQPLITSGVLSATATTFTGLAVDSLMFGGEGVQLFVGYGPYFVDSNGDGVINGSDTPGAEAVGFVLNGLAFGLALLTDRSGAFPAFFALKGTATGLAVVGLPFLTLSASVIEVALNLGGKWKPDQDRQPFVNWKASFGASGYAVTPNVKLDFDQLTLKLALTAGKISILDFFHIQGSFAFEKGARYTANIKNDTGLGSAVISAEMDVMTLGGQNLSAFVGYGSINAAGVPTSGSVGLSIQNLSFGLGLFKLANLALLPDVYRDKAIFVALNAHVDSAGFVGTESVATIRVWDVTLQLNTLVVVLGGKPVPLPIYIDFTAFPNGSFPIPTGAAGSTPVLVNYNTWLIRASIGFFEMQVAGSLYLAGSLNLDMGQQKTVTLSDNSTTDVMIMTISAVGVYGFLGFNGPYRRDANGDHKIDALDVPNLAAVGFALENLNLSIVIMKALPLLTNPAIFFALQASLDSLALVGVANVTASATGLRINVNLGIDPLHLANPPVVDFMRSFPGTGYLVNPAAAVPVYMTYTARLVEAQGTLTLAVANTLFLSGSFNLKITETELSLLVTAAFDLKAGGTSLLTGTASGTIRFTQAGLVGYVALQIGAGVPAGSGFSLSGRFQFEINTTTASQTIKRFTVNQDGVVVDLNHDGKIDENDYVNSTIAASSLRVFVGGALSIPGFLDFKGSFELKFRQPDLEINFNASVNLLGSFFSVTGSGGVYGGAAGGVAFVLVITGSLNLPGLAFNAQFDVRVNSTSVARTFGAITLSAQTFLIHIKGNLTVLNTVTITGDFNLQVNPAGFTVEVSGTVSIPLFGSLNVFGSMRLTSAGLVASLSIGGGTNQSLSSPSISQIAISGRLQIEVNTTSSVQTIQRLVIDEQTGVVSGLVDGTIAAQTVRLSVGGQFTVAGLLTISGSLDLTLTPTRITVSFKAYLSMGLLGTFRVEGGAIFSVNPAYFAMYLDLGAQTMSLTDNQGDIGGVEIFGSLVIQINTSSTAQCIGGTGAGCTGGHLVNPNTYKLTIDGTLHFWLLQVSAKCEIGLENGLFKIAVDVLVDFQGFSLHVSGYIKSDGKFRFQGSAVANINFGPFVMRGGIDLLVTNDPYQLYLRIYGSIRIYIDMPWFMPDIDVTLARVDASVDISGYGIKVYVTACVAGICLNGSLVWHSNLYYWGGIGGGSEPPFLATQEGDTLYLHMGVDAEQRGFLYYTAEPSESFLIEHLSTEPDGSETVMVTACGLSESFSGVTRIVVRDAGEGNDTLFIGSQVRAMIEVHGGAGDDYLFSAGDGRTVFYGDDGNDTFISANGSCEFYGGQGNDDLSCGNLYGAFVDNRLYGDAGDDTFRVDGSYDHVSGGEGWDTVVLYYEGAWVHWWESIESFIYILPISETALRGENGQMSGPVSLSGGVLLSLPNGDEVYFAPGSGQRASLTRIFKNRLPAALPHGLSLISAMLVKVWIGRAIVPQFSTTIKVSFVIPAVLKDFEFVILFWDESANQGAGGWVEVPSFRLRAWLLNNERQEAWGSQPGLYVLALRGLHP